MNQSATSLRLVKIAVIIGFLLFSLLFSNKFLPSEIVSGKSALAAPLAPTSVRATDNQYYNKVGVYWDTMRDATGYRIFRGTPNNPGGCFKRFSIYKANWNASATV